MPLQYRGAMTPVLNWLASLPATALDARPSLWVMYALALTMVSAPISRVEQILQAAEAALQGRPDRMPGPETWSGTLPPFGPCWLSLGTR